MSEPLKISTEQFTKKGKVNVDGHIWDVKLPGAGTELRFSQASRATKLYGARLELLDKKIENSTATEEDLNNYEKYAAKYEENERIVYDTFTATFRDGTKDNSEVKKWVDETPTVIIMLAMDDVREQANAPEEAKPSESNEQSDSSDSKKN